MPLIVIWKHKNHSLFVATLSVSASGALFPSNFFLLEYFAPMYCIAHTSDNDGHMWYAYYLELRTLESDVNIHPSKFSFASFEKEIRVRMETTSTFDSYKQIQAWRKCCADFVYIAKLYFSFGFFSLEFAFEWLSNFAESIFYRCFHVHRMNVRQVRCLLQPHQPPARCGTYKDQRRRPITVHRDVTTCDYIYMWLHADEHRCDFSFHFLLLFAVSSTSSFSAVRVIQYWNNQRDFPSKCRFNACDCEFRSATTMGNSMRINY